VRTEPLRFSIVIPTYNRKDTLRRCLAAATSQDYPDYEVIVVDDASTDGTDEMVRREFPQVRYIRQEPNRGPAAARNRGIEAAGHPPRARKTGSLWYEQPGCVAGPPAPFGRL